MKKNTFLYSFALLSPIFLCGFVCGGISGVYAQASSSSDIVANPNFALRIDEQKYQRIAAEMGLPAQVMFLAAKDMLALKDKIARLGAVNFYTLDTWLAWGDCPDNHYVLTKAANDAAWRLPIVRGRFGVYSPLNVPLRADEPYIIEIRYRYLGINDSIYEAQEPVCVVLSEKIPTPSGSSAIWTSKLPLPTDQAARLQEAKRKRVIAAYQRQYGGVYPDDFARAAPLETWQTASISYRATGKEHFIILFPLAQSASLLGYCHIDALRITPKYRYNTKQAGDR